MDLLRDGGDVFLARERQATHARVGSHVVEVLERYLAEFPGPLRFRAVKQTAQLDAEATVPWQVLAREVDALRTAAELPSEAPVVLLTTQRGGDEDWVSGVNPQRLRDLFVRVTDWGWVTPAPLVAILAVEVLQNLLEGQLRLRGTEFEALTHERASGCLNDKCDELRDFSLKLRTADLCTECLARLEGAGASEALLRQVVAILEGGRVRAMSTSRYRDVPARHDDWAYPVAVTRHKATLANDPFHRFHLYLDHFDSLVRYLVLVGAARAGEALTLATPSLGWWVSQLQHSSERAARAAHKVATREQLVALRNDTRGHGYAPSSTHALDGLTDEVKAALDEIEREATPLLAGTVLVAVKELTFADGFVVTGTRLQGSNSLFSPFAWRADAAQTPAQFGLSRGGQVALFLETDKRFASLDPFVVRAQCGECRHERILVVDHVVDGKWTYLDPLVGHRTQLG
jgi:hypothetical protein